MKLPPSIRLFLSRVTPIRLVLAALLVFSVLYALAFVGIYREKHPYDAASEWIFQNAKPGSTILGPHWDDKVPLSIDGHHAPTTFHMEGPGMDLPFYERDTTEKITQLVNSIADADYIAFPTPRIQGSIPRLPIEYPHTTALLQLLWSENLGFKLVATFKSRPSILGLTFNDDLADESFSVYDHPKVSIFRNVEHLSAAELRSRVLAPNQYDSLPSLNEILLTDSSGRASPQRRASGWADAIRVLILVELLSLCCIILFLPVFDFASDRGWGVSKALGILALGLPAWLLSAAGVTLIHQSTLAVVVIALVAAAAHRWFWNRDIRQRLREAWASHGVVVELLFCATFLIYLGVRSLAPEIVGPDRMSGASLLGMFLRNGVIPPLDPWTAGVTVRYPYLGAFFVAMIAKVAGVSLATSYNISFALLGASVAAGIYSLVALLSSSRWWVAGTALAVVVAGNWQTFYELGIGRGQLSVNSTVVEVASGALAQGTFTPALMAWPLGVLFLFLIRGTLVSLPSGGTCSILPGVLAGVVFAAILGTSPFDAIVYGITALLIVIVSMAALYDEGKVRVSLTTKRIGVIGGAFVAAFAVVAWPYYTLSLPLLSLGARAVDADVPVATYAGLICCLGWGPAALAIFFGGVVLCVIGSDKPRRRTFLVLPLALAPWALLALAVIGGVARPSWGAVMMSTVVILCATLVRLPHRAATEESWLRGLVLGAGFFIPVCEVLGISLSGHVYDITLINLAAGAVLLLAFERLRTRTEGIPLSGALRGLSGLMAVVALSAVLCGFGAIYVVCTERHAASYSGSLNGSAFLDDLEPSDAALVRWLNRSIPGGALTVAAPGEHGARIAAHSGLATLIGWSEGRGVRSTTESALIRRSAADTLYATSAPQEAYSLLQGYGVDLVVVGPAERRRYPQSGLQKFDKHRDLFTKIYEVEGAAVYATAFSTLYPQVQSDQ